MAERGAVAHGRGDARTREQLAKGAELIEYDTPTRPPVVRRRFVVLLAVAAAAAVAVLSAAAVRSHREAERLGRCRDEVERFVQDQQAIWIAAGQPVYRCVGGPYQGWSGSYDPGAQSATIRVSPAGQRQWDVTTDVFYTTVLWHETGHAYMDRAAKLEAPGRRALFQELRHITAEAVTEDAADTFAYYFGHFDDWNISCAQRYCWTHQPSPDEIRALREAGFLPPR